MVVLADDRMIRGFLERENSKQVKMPARKHVYRLILAISGEDLVIFLSGNYIDYRPCYISTRPLLVNQMLIALQTAKKVTPQKD